MRKQQLGVSFGDKHSVRDLKLILKSMKIGIPEPKTSIIDVPGRNGNIDASEYIYDSPVYDNRELIFNFAFSKKDKWAWETWKSRILNLIHGRKLQIVLDNSLSWYYLGRVKVEASEDDGSVMNITVKVDADPFKYSFVASADGENWKWDELNFVDGVIYQHKFSVPAGTTTISVPNSSMSVVPTIIANNVITLEFKGKTYSIDKNAIITDPTIMLTNGSNEMKITAQKETVIKINFKVGIL